LVEADLVAAPSGNLYDDTTYALTWDIMIGGGWEGVGPAGAAALRPPGSDLVAWFDYARPDRLLAISAPFGTGEMREDLAEHFELVHRGRFSALDSAVLDVLLGAECRVELESARREQFSALINAQSSRAALGRVALLDTYLDRIDGRPVDGLWALDQAALLRPMARAEPIRAWAAGLVDRARPVLGVLDTSWAAPPRDDGLRHLEHCLAVAADISRTDVGALGAKFREQRAKEILAEAAAVFDGPPITQGRGLATVGAGDAQPASVVVTMRGTPPLRAKIDFSAQDLVSNVSLRLDGARLRLHVTTVEAARAVGRRIEVRVSTTSGKLLAGAVSMSSDGPGGDLNTELTLPSGVASQDLVVVVGRHLPLDGLGEHGFAVRQATEQSARALDAARRRDAGDNDTASVWDELHLAEQYWADARDEGRAAQLRTAFSAPPFLAERLRLHRQSLRPWPTEGSEADLRAYRSLAWSMADEAAAARIESSRVRLGAGAESLSDRALEALALAARRNGDLESASVLEDAAVDVLYR
jgi:hypothetical protein